MGSAGRGWEEVWVKDFITPECSLSWKGFGVYRCMQLSKFTLWTSLYEGNFSLKRNLCKLYRTFVNAIQTVVPRVSVLVTNLLFWGASFWRWVEGYVGMIKQAWLDVNVDCRYGVRHVHCRILSPLWWVWKFHKEKLKQLKLVGCVVPPFPASGSRGLLKSLQLPGTTLRDEATFAKQGGTKDHDLGDWTKWG